MFAPRVAKLQTKVAADSMNGLAHQRSTLVARPFGGGTVEGVLELQRTIGNQATLRLLGRQTSRPAVSNPPSDYEQGAGATKNTMTEETSRGASWDFSKNPLFLPDRASRGSSPQPSIIQRKLVVGQPNDPLEHEADRVADQVMRMPDPWVSIGTAQPQISRKCDASEQGEELQKRAAGRQAVISGVPSSVHEVLRMPGEPLDAATRAYFEPRFGRDFSGVRVHADAAAARSAREVNARAYTVGHNIAFDSGRFATASQAGRHLIAHELMHVVQQSQGKPLLQREPQRDPKPRWVSPKSGDVQPAEPVYDIKVNPNNVDWRGQNHTLQEALDEAFKKVCYDDNGVSTGVAKDQLHESAWVKTSYGKTVPVEWKGPGNAEVSIDVAHNPPGPDIPHVGWRRPGKGGKGHIFLDETPYGRPPLDVPPAEYPTPPRKKAATTKTASTSAKVEQAGETAETVAKTEATATKSTIKAERATSATETAVKAERSVAARAAATVAELGKIGALDAATFYLELHDAHFAALEEVSKRAEAARTFLSHVAEFESGARALRERVNQQRRDEANLPADPLDTGKQASFIVTADDLDYVSAYRDAAIRVSDDAFHARLELNRIIQGWDSALAQAEKTGDFTRKALNEAVADLDLRFAKEKGGSFRAFVVEARDDAGRVEYFATLKWKHAREILDTANAQELRTQRVKAREAQERAARPGGGTPGGYGDDVVRFASTGKQVTSDSLVSWAHQNYPGASDNPRVMQRMLNNIYASQEFTGSQDAREGAAMEVVLRLQEEKKLKRQR